MKLTLNTAQELETAFRINSLLEEGSELTIELRMGNSTADMSAIQKALDFGYNISIVKNSGYEGFSARIKKAEKETHASVTWITGGF